MVLTLLKLNLIYLILCINYGELNSKSINGHQTKDSGLYDNASDVSTFNNNEFYNFNSQYKLLSTDGHLEQSIMPAEVIEGTTPITNKKDFNSSLEDAEENALNINDMESLLLNFNNDDGNTCLLDDIKTAIRWWSYPNGTLRASELNIIPITPHVDLSHRNISQDLELYDFVESLDNLEIVAFSAAHNSLSTVPKHTLKLLGTSLKYLTLAGNKFVAETQAEEQDDLKDLLNNGNVVIKNFCFYYNSKS